MEHKETEVPKGTPEELAPQPDLVLGGDKFDLADITKCYTEQPDVVDVYVPLPDGRTATLKFSPFPRRSEYDAIIREGTEKYQQIPDKGSKAFAIHPWKDCLPESLQECVEAYTIHKLSVEPKISMETALVWLIHPNLVKNILEQIESSSNLVYSIWLRSAVAQKKSSLSTTSIESGSLEPASTDRAECPTN